MMSFFMVLPQTGWLETVMTVSLRREIYLVYLFKKEKEKKKCTVFKKTKEKLFYPF